MIKFRYFVLSAAVIPVLITGISDSISALPLSSPQLVAFRWRIDFWRRRPRVPLAIRGSISSSVCPVSPGLIETMSVWHDRPMFVWHSPDTQANVGVEVNVRDYDTRSTVWTETINTAQNYAPYAGQTALQPGKIYQWQVISAQSRSSDRKSWTSFQILAVPEREKLTAELDSLEQKSKSRGASDEDIALQKADFFADKQLWADAVQVLHEVKNPSAAFIEQRQQYVMNLCK